jgi:GT2 family glycosyltransferase
MKMDISIILPVYNNIEHTKTSLKDLHEKTGEAKDAIFHIIVVDDGSTDGTSSWISANFPNVIIVAGDGNLWWSGAVNAGVRYATENLNTDYFLLWNNDITSGRDYFINLCSILGRNLSRTITGSKIYVAENDSLIWSMGGYFNPRTGDYNMYGYYKNDSPEYDKPKEADWLTGMGTVIPAEAIKEIGWWDNIRFPQYHGDSDYTFRARLKGYKIIVYPELRIYNKVKSSGIQHNGKFRMLVKLLTDIRSKSNVSRNFMFYRLYSTSPRAYLPLIWLYIQIIGGFFKWQLLSVFKIKKKVPV